MRSKAKQEHLRASDLPATANSSHPVPWQLLQRGCEKNAGAACQLDLEDSIRSLASGSRDGEIQPELAYVELVLLRRSLFGDEKTQNPLHALLLPYCARHESFQIAALESSPMNCYPV